MKKLLILIMMLVTLTSYSQQESLIYPNMLIIDENDATQLVDTPFRINYYGDYKEINRVEITQQITGKYTILRIVSKMYLVKSGRETFIGAEYFDGNEVLTAEYYQDFKEVVLRRKTTTYYFKL